MEDEDGCEQTYKLAFLASVPPERDRRAQHVTAEAQRYAVQDEVRVDPAKTALLVIDMQNDFVKPGGGLLVPDAEATVPAIKVLLDLARSTRMRVVYSQDTHRRGDPEWEIWPEHCREGSWGWQIVRELEPAADDTVLGKIRHDAFYGTPLDHLLRRWDVDTVVICGTVAKPPAVPARWLIVTVRVPQGARLIVDAIVSSLGRGQVC